MMSGLRRVRRGPRAFTDLAPLVDVTLMLVVFFLLTSQAVDVTAIDVDLPQAETGAALAANEAGRERLEILADGTLLLGATVIELEALATAVASSEQMIIAADAACRHGRVVAVVDALRAAGVAQIYYATADVEVGVADW
ncbi:MAG: ExbD/TolR family protein [Planctomycetota bacterium]|jgi:biopolymer transport protein ExbD